MPLGNSVRVIAQSGKLPNDAVCAATCFESWEINQMHRSHSMSAVLKARLWFYLFVLIRPKRIWNQTNFRKQKLSADKCGGVHIHAYTHTHTHTMPNKTENVLKGKIVTIFGDLRKQQQTWRKKRKSKFRNNKITENSSLTEATEGKDCKKSSTERNEILKGEYRQHEEETKAWNAGKIHSLQIRSRNWGRNKTVFKIMKENYLCSTVLQGILAGIRSK